MKQRKKEEEQKQKDQRLQQQVQQKEEQKLKKLQEKQVLQQLKEKEKEAKRGVTQKDQKKKQKLSKYESKLAEMEEKQRERSTKKAEKQKAYELKHKLKELKRKEKAEKKAKKIEAKEVVKVQQEEEIEAKETQKQLDVDLKKELKEKKKRAKQEELFKRIEAKRALKEQKTEERVAKRLARLEAKRKTRKLSKYESKLAEMEEKRQEQATKEAEKQKKKGKKQTGKEPITKDENIEQIDFYPVNEPFAYIKILKNTQTLEKFYKVIQPNLSEKEYKIFNFIKDKLIKTMDTRLDELDPTLSENYLLEFMDQIIREHEIMIDGLLLKKLIYYAKREFLALGTIDPLMKDPNIEDISCDGSGVPIFLHHKKYGSVKSNIVFKDEDELSAFVINLAQKCGKHISLAEPMLDATMPDGSRIQMTLSDEITAKGSTFTIRKFRADPITPTDLIGYHTMSPEMVAFMWLAVENGINALIAGSTAAGKTSTLNALSLFIPRESKIVSIEETREINLPHANWIPGIARSGFGEIKNDKMVGEIDLFDLMKAALRQRPEYILVGEIRGREAYVLFQAMATGHTTYSTFHADSPKSVIHRLEGKPIDIPRVMLQSLDIVFIQVSTRVGGKNVRRCKHIVEIIDIDPNTKEILSNEVFRWDPVDDRFIYSGKSYILERIRVQHDMSKEDMTQEVQNRVTVLEWMRKKDIRVFKDVARIISTYAENQGELLKNIQKDERIKKVENV
jgi:flagellar protein FlaI